MLCCVAVRTVLPAAQGGGSVRPLQVFLCQLTCPSCFPSLKLWALSQRLLGQKAHTEVVVVSEDEFSHLLSFSAGLQVFVFPLLSAIQSSGEPHSTFGRRMLAPVLWLGSLSTVTPQSSWQRAGTGRRGLCSLSLLEKMKLQSLHACRFGLGPRPRPTHSH